GVEIGEHREVAGPYLGVAALLQLGQRGRLRAPVGVQEQPAQGQRTQLLRAEIRHKKSPVNSVVYVARQSPGSSNQRSSSNPAEIPAAPRPSTQGAAAALAKRSLASAR